MSVVNWLMHSAEFVSQWQEVSVEQDSLGVACVQAF